MHIEQQWAENALTAEGHILHERVHDAGFTESRGAVLLSRAMPVRSRQLRITGECDMVELHKDPGGIPIRGRDGLWTVYPVEYKRGEPDKRGADEMQLCAQAMCLEEMLVTDIPEGAIYYAELRHRKTIALTQELRQQVKESVAEMHRLFEQGHTPRCKQTRACKSCSLKEICEQELFKKLSASEYIRRALKEGAEQ